MVGFACTHETLENNETEMETETVENHPNYFLFYIFSVRNGNEKANQNNRTFKNDKVGKNILITVKNDNSSQKIQ
jgi:hypothetical protein